MKKEARKRFTWKAKTSDISDPQKIKKRVEPKKTFGNETWELHYFCSIESGKHLNIFLDLRKRN